MALQMDEQAPGVSATLRRRIASALEAGERPTLQGNNLKLGSIVLQSANGVDRPALRETEIQMRRRNIDTSGAFDIYNSAPVRRGRGRYATDVNGIERMVTRTVNGEQRVTAAGRRYYNQSYTRWLVHIPTILVRRSTGATFQRTRHDRTGEELGLSTELQARGSEAEQRQQVQRAVQDYLQQAGGQNAELDFYEGDENVIDFLSFSDYFSGVIKATVFGFIISIISCYNGLYSEKGAFGVGSATTNAVVLSSILILVFNYFLTEIFF